MKPPNVTKADIKEIRRELAKFRAVLKICRMVIDATPTISDSLNLKIIKVVNKKLDKLNSKFMKINNRLDRETKKALGRP